MLNKALEYLLNLFGAMQEGGQKLTTSEAEAFIPYLILKVSAVAISSAYCHTIPRLIYLS